ncbi:MAG: DNA internalization-related competence protein ComEC/Rec2 [Blautia sp.]|nr:DNA internalization-related competence protein ComEC/Rec2 [Blautia sp.]
MDLAGIPLVRGNPLPESVRQEVSLCTEATVIGEAVRCTDTESSHSVYLKHVCLIRNSEKISIQNLRAFFTEKPEVPVGAYVVLSGKLEEVEKPRNPGEFDSRQYYAAQHIYYLLKKASVRRISDVYDHSDAILYRIKKMFFDLFEAGAGSDAPLFETMLLGDKSSLDEELKLKYQAAGILHILAISGLHISIIGMGIFRLLNLTGAGIYLSGFLSLLVIVPYGAMTGESVSAMRAICMFLLAVGARLLGKSYDRMTALALAAILLLLESPAYLYSSSFLMSFAAVIGIGVIVPVLEELLDMKSKPGKAILSSLAVQLTMLPVLLIFYGEVSLSGIFLNLLVLPTVGVILLSGISGAICGIGHQGIGLLTGETFGSGAGMAAKVLFLPGRLLLHLYELICGWILQLPFCTWVPGCPAWWQILGYYCVLTGCLLAGKYLKKAERTNGIRILCFGGMIVSCLLLEIKFSDRMQITCLDVGQGDGIVIETPEHTCILIDGGSTSRNRIGTSVMLPFLKHQGITTVDAVFISHTDEDHINGITELLELMEKKLVRLRIRKLFLPEWKTHPSSYEKLLKLADADHIEVFYVKQGDRIQDGKLSIRVLAPEIGASGEDTNESAQVLELDYGDFRSLFTGDIGMGTEEKLLPQFSDIDFLKVAHHGSKYSTGEAFLEATKPELAVISCSAANLYGHPSPETVDRLEAAGAQVEYTMKSGAVRISTDGKRIWLRTPSGL